jgi:GT2 family glycosyltransferase
MNEPSKPVELSVLMPTHNRAEQLKETLDAYKRQEADHGLSFEVVVVDDGSTDGTAAVLAAFDPEGRFTLKTHALSPPGGPAAARNAGIRHLAGVLVLITGDDVVPAPGMVRRHREWHRAHPDPAEALLGRVTWPEALSPTPFMRWLEGGGRGFFFNYADIPDSGTADYDRFYTCNVSLKRSLIEKAGFFDESFPFASHEDLEFGWRLSRAGMRLHYDPGAEGFHWHRLTVPDTAKRVYIMGYSSGIYWQKVKDTAGLLRRAGRGVLSWMGATRPFAALLRFFIRWSDRKTVPPAWVWSATLHLCYWCGKGDYRRGREARAADLLSTS